MKDTVLMQNYDVLRDCSRLEEEKTFKNLFEIICSHGGASAAEWLEGSDIKHLTYKEQCQQSDNFASYFTIHFGNEGRVCVCIDSCKEWFPVFWGLIRSGHDILAVDAAASDLKIESLMHEAGCHKLVASTHHNIECDQILLSELANIPDVNDYQAVWAKNVALCTSGTSSDSRVFVYDEETICYFALYSRKAHKENKFLVEEKSYKCLAFLPFHHVLGFSTIFILGHFLGNTMVYIKERTPQTITDTCKKCRVNQIITIPLLANNISRGICRSLEKEGRMKSGFVKMLMSLSLFIQAVMPRLGLKIAKKMFNSLQKEVLGNDLNTIMLGGSSTDPSSLRILNAIGYYTVCGFGMTETGINSVNNSFNIFSRLRGYIGKPIEYSEYRIIDKDGNPCNIGELQVRGKCLHDNRIVNGEIIKPDIDENGWFSTGDIAKIGRISKNYSILGRLKEVIINESGENVYPDELEMSFNEIQGIEQLSILGTEKTNSKYEDITLVMSVGNRFYDEKLINSLCHEVAKINKTLPVYKRLNRILLTSELLPMTNTHKVKRNELRAKIASKMIDFRELDITKKFDKNKIEKEDSAKQRTSEKLRRQLTEIFADILGVKVSEIDPDMNIIEHLGGDSLQVLSIISKVEDVFGVMIPSELYADCTTVNDTAAVIEKLINGGGETSNTESLQQRKPVVRFEDSGEYQQFKKRIDALHSDGVKNPYFVCHDSPLLDTSIVEGREMLDFGNYNYVGMSGRKEVSEAAKAAIDRYGTSASGSRLLAGERPVHGELERELAEWKHAEKALVCVGGHSTNVTVVGNFCGKNDLILYDALAHNSVEQGCQLSMAVSRPFPHNDVEALEKILKAQRGYFEKVLVVIEGVYSMDGDIAPVPDFIALKKKYGCFLMVDEAHSACVLGPTGGGVDEYFHLNGDDIDIKMGTLSKGLGTCGGYVAGKANLIDYLRYNLPGFVFSVGMSPALAAGSLAAIRLLRSRPEIMQNLHRNIKCFADEAKKRKLDLCLGGEAAVIPIMVGRDEDAFVLSNELEKRGILVPPAVYPAVPRNKARLRFDVISEHKPEQFVKALDTLVEVAAELGINLPTKEY